MKNTKISFYWTVLDSREFSKIIFSCIVPEKFNNIHEVKDWEVNNTLRIFHIFDFNIVFDHVIINYEETDEEIYDVKIEKQIRGKLIFNDEIFDTQKIINLYKEQINLYKEQVEILNKTIKKTKRKIESIQKIKKEYPSLWIEPDGSKHVVGTACHNEFAFEWLDQQGYYDNRKYHDNNKYDYEILQDEFRWCRILGWTNPPQFVIPKKITPKMMNSIRDYCHTYGIQYPEEIKEKL